MEELAGYLSSQVQLIDHKLDQLLSPRRGHNQQLFEAARYSILGAGKRIRPLLTLATTEMLNGNVQSALVSACALEMVHGYSLIHDDLPCMDDDDYRRGKLTVHKKYSEGLAVLTGDFLLTYAFEILATQPHLSSEKKLELIALLSKRIGADGMIGGQVMDLAYEGKTVSSDTLKLLHRSKTGALITASIEFGGIISSASDIQMEHLREFGENIGLAFQIVDDILDVTSSQAKHGRQVSSDVINKKSTYATLLGIEQSRAHARQLYEQAVKALRPFPYPSSRMIDLAHYVVHRQQ